MTGRPREPRRRPPPADPAVWPTPQLVHPVREARGLAVARAQLAQEKADAIAVIVTARTLLHLVEPETMRVSLDYLFRATLERIRRARTLLGLPVVYVLDMASAIVMEQARREQ